MNDLDRRLRDAVPPTPDLSGLAARASGIARRRRSRRRTGLLGAAAVLVLGAVAAPGLVRDDLPEPGPGPGPGLGDPAASAEAPDCVAAADAPRSALTPADARWVRFCPLAEEGSAQRARYPDGAVTGGVAEAVVAGWGEGVLDRRACTEDAGTTYTRLYRIQVGLADGSVAELTGDTGCSTADERLFGSLETALLSQNPGSGNDPRPADAVVCPERFTTTRTNTDGTSAAQLVDEADQSRQSTVPLLPLPAAFANVCVYRGTGPRRDLVEQWGVGTPTAEAIRARATTGYSDGVTDCPLDASAPSYLVVLHDASGTRRTFSLDPTQCSPMSAAIGTPPRETYLGLAAPDLVELVAGSRPRR